MFARALDPATAVPDDIAALPEPRLGFYGTIRDWVDLDLIAAIARARPHWSIVLIGQQLGDVSAVRGLHNVHLLGQRPHAALPAYCKGMTVGMIPYRIDERMPFVNPLKLREYLSAGLPVISTPVPEAARYAQLGVHVAATPDEMVGAVELALRADNLAARRARSAAMAQETWSARVADVTRTLQGLPRTRS
jgi:glycosyltransferase involved in cell wall biosynthesis